MCGVSVVRGVQQRFGIHRILKGYDIAFHICFDTAGKVCYAIRTVDGLNPRSTAMSVRSPPPTRPVVHVSTFSNLRIISTSTQQSRVFKRSQDSLVDVVAVCAASSALRNQDRSIPSFAQVRLNILVRLLKRIKRSELARILAIV